MHSVLLLEVDLTITLLEPKVISLCLQYGARPDCTYMQSYQTLYWLTNFKFPKNDNGLSKKWKVDYSV